MTVQVSVAQQVKLVNFTWQRSRY